MSRITPFSKLQVPTEGIVKPSTRSNTALKLFSLCIIVGCSDGEVRIVRHEPQEAAPLAMETYDANSDGSLDSKELERIPSLRSALGRIDTDRNGELTSEEIARRLEQHRTQSEFVGTVVRLTLRGQPLADAMVSLEMEPFLGDHLPSYVGQSDETGEAALKTDMGATPGLPLGFYQVRVRRSGRIDEVIFGCEIADDVPEVNRLHFDLP